MTAVLDWFWRNKEWIFSGIGVAILVAIIGWIRGKPSGGQSQRSGKNSTNIQSGRDINIGGGQHGRK